MPKHLEDPETEHRRLAIAVARFRSRNLTQAQIAKRLNKSQPEVSRLVAYAKEHQFLARAPSFLIQNVDLSDLAEVDRRFFVHDELCPELRKLAPAGRHLDVRVLPPGDEAFAAAAASCVGEWLHRARVVGIMWGRSLERMVTRIRGCLDASGQGEAYDVQCVPLCGDPVHLMNLGQVRYSASQLAAELSRALNPERPSDQPCLVGVPAYVPRKIFLQRNGGAVWQDFVEEIPGYRLIFGPGNGEEKPWVERVDTIISGTGIIISGSRRQDHTAPPAGMAAHDQTGDFIRERLTQEEGVSESALAELIYGDIGGWLLGRHGLRAADRRLVDSLNQGWTGIREEHLVNVAKNAKPGGAPGVILVAAGLAKVEMVRELVRRGFVNQLLIDTSLAKALR
jgi:DNA-binding transcriptional regulator LsrR (DeoR family)